MAEAKCMKCLGSASGDSFEDARKKINHAVGLSRGMPCGDSFGRVVEINTEKKPAKQTSKKKTKTIETILDKTKSKIIPSQISKE